MKSIVANMSHNATVRKWGNGHGVLIPRVLIDTLKWKDARVTTTLHGSSIVITKAPLAKKQQVTLKDMVRGMNAKDPHALVDFGAPVGKEIW